MMEGVWHLAVPPVPCDREREEMEGGREEREAGREGGEGVTER